MQIAKAVTGASSDQEIMDAIDEAGDKCPSWRPHDRTKDANPKSWVMANDIGRSDQNDRTLMKKLKDMTSRGLLEMKTYSSRSVDKSLVMQLRPIHYEGAPRFRVVRT